MEPFESSRWGLFPARGLRVRRRFAELLQGQPNPEYESGEAGAGVVSTSAVVICEQKGSKRHNALHMVDTILKTWRAKKLVFDASDDIAKENQQRYVVSVQKSIVMVWDACLHPVA